MVTHVPLRPSTRLAETAGEVDRALHKTPTENILQKPQASHPFAQSSGVPYITYAVLTWMATLVWDKVSLEYFHRCFTRMILGPRGINHRERLQSASAECSETLKLLEDISEIAAPLFIPGDSQALRGHTIKPKSSES